MPLMKLLMSVIAHTLYPFIITQKDNRTDRKMLKLHQALGYDSINSTLHQYKLNLHQAFPQYAHHQQ